ncbi:MAG: hypothetical protein NZ898_08060 [Myxococcota bacterium]|nr:hypothetical protein [Myxococcota bacterium]MDW8363179.1 DUF4350 domain-containing protein [Myxococcales bacterium]
MSRAATLAGGVAAVAMVLFVAHSCDRVARRGRHHAPYSTYASGPQGTRALYLLSRRWFEGTTRLTHDFGRLPEGAVVVAIGGCGQREVREPSRFERETVVRWIERGGVLLVAGSGPMLWDALEIDLVPRCTEDPGWVRRAETALEEGLRGATGASGDPVTDTRAPGTSLRPVAPELFGLSALTAREPARVVVHRASPGAVRVLLEDDTGEPHAVMVRRGRGAVVALSSASFWLNGEIGEGDGAPLFVRLIRMLGADGPVIFDEYHLGVGMRRSITQWLGELGVGPLVLQLGVVLGVLLWGVSVRFGAPIAPLPEPPAGAGTHVGALGELYRRVGDVPATVELIVRDAFARIAAHHHAPGHDPERLAAWLVRAGRREAASAVRELDALGRRSVDRRTLLARIGEVDDLVRRATQPLARRRPGG